MSTNQKITLGIAAVFMVALTVVGVTYAYFVTRVAGTTSESINVQAAQVGSIQYNKGNGTSDTITLSNTIPGKTIYKTFSVENTATDANSYASYTIYLESFPTESKPHFVHAKATTACYTSTAVQSNQTGATATCFDNTEYNNIYITLYEIQEDDMETITEDSDGGVDLSTVVQEETKVAALAGATTTDRASQDLSSLITIPGKAKKYYVLKVEYRDANANQNIENEAELSLKVNIK